MALRDKMAANAQPLLEQGEQIQVTFAGQTSSGWMAVVPLLSLIFNRYDLIVATDRRIVLFDCGKWGVTKPRTILASLPRITQIGPPSGLWWKCTSFGPTCYVHKRFHKDVEQVDALRPTS
jgi:hypothetical protein